MGKYQTIGYKYYMSWAIGLCSGPVDELLTVFRNEDVVWSGNLVRPVSGGQETIVLSDMGSMTFYFGTDDQAANAALGALMPDATLNTPYRGLCWAFFNDCYIGDYNRMPTMKFVLRKTPEQAFSEHNVIQTLDYNPAHAIRYILHDMNGLPETWLHDADFAAAAATLAGETRGISVCFSSQQDAMSYIETINGHIDGILRYGGDGKFHPKLIRNDYTVGDLPLIDESVVLDDPAFSRKSWIDTTNELKVQYSEITLARPDVWLVDGVVWTGTVALVGEGKEYATIYDALYDTQIRDIGNNIIAEEDVLVIVSPGTYTESLTGPVINYLGERLVRIRGVGDLWTDVVITGTIVVWHGDFLMEWVTHSPTAVNSALSFYSDDADDTDIYANKCRMSATSSSTFPLATTGVAPYETTYCDITLKNCLVKPDSAWWDIYTPGTTEQYYDISTWRMQKVQHLTHVSVSSWSMFHSIGSMAEDDTTYVHEEDVDVDGYGPSYGSFRIMPGAPGTGDDIKKSTADPYAVDVGNREIQGRVVSKTIQTALFTTNANAVWAAMQNLRKLSYPFAAINFPANRDAFRIEVGDCFKFSYAKYGISNMLCRVLQIGEDGPESETITISAAEDVFSVINSVTVITLPTRHAVPAADYTVIPFTHQRITEAPYALTTDIKLLPIACRESAHDLGFEVYMSVDGGSSFFFIQRTANLQPYGTLAEAYPADTFTIDIETGITVDFVAGADLLETVTWGEVFAGIKNIGIIDDEIISFQSITPVSGTEYKLEGIIRGRYGTQKQAHSIGAEFYAIMPGAVDLIANAEIATGAVRKFKYVPYNTKASGAIADATALDLTIDGLALTPYMPGNLAANGGSFAARYDTDIVLTWSPRYRGKGAGIGLPGTVLAETDKEGLFKVEVYVAAALVRTTDAIDAATWTYTAAMNTADNGSPASAVTFEVSNYRTEGGKTYESAQAEVTCKKN